jgi:hypothetical protein
VLTKPELDAVLKEAVQSYLILPASSAYAGMMLVFERNGATDDMQAVERAWQELKPYKDAYERLSNIKMLRAVNPSLESGVRSGRFCVESHSGARISSMQLAQTLIAQRQRLADLERAPGPPFSEENLAAAEERFNTMEKQFKRVLAEHAIGLLTFRPVVADETQINSIKSNSSARVAALEKQLEGL